MTLVRPVRGSVREQKESPDWLARLLALGRPLVMGVLSMLGTAGIPPGGLVNYLLLPFWLIATAVILARRQIEAPARSGPIATHPMP